jgi:NitT/TauT family transport system ATP-binding protein
VSAPLDKVGPATIERLPATEDAPDPDPAAAPLVRFDDVSKYFLRDGRLVETLRGLDISIPRGQFVSLIGPSGCGKSTLLNLAAGLLQPTSGTVLFDGAPPPEPNTRVGYITQRDNLLPWKTVRKNVELPLRLKRRSGARERAQEVIELVGLVGFEDAYPNELSGGMRKRAAMARTLVYGPEVLLADEPFGALDAQLKVILGRELMRVWESTRQTTIFVTHDIAEAIALSDRVILFTPRPAQVRIDCTIDLPRPRDILRVRSTPRFGELHDLLWSALSDDMDRGSSN